MKNLNSHKAPEGSPSKSDKMTGPNEKETAHLSIGPKATENGRDQTFRVTLSIAGSELFKFINPQVESKKDACENTGMDGKSANKVVRMPSTEFPTQSTYEEISMHLPFPQPAFDFKDYPS
jgi:hypothetical protein